MQAIMSGIWSDFDTNTAKYVKWATAYHVHVCNNKQTHAEHCQIIGKR